MKGKGKGKGKGKNTSRGKGHTLPRVCDSASPGRCQAFAGSFGVVGGVVHHLAGGDKTQRRVSAVCVSLSQNVLSEVYVNGERCSH